MLFGASMLVFDAIASCNRRVYVASNQIPIRSKDDRYDGGSFMGI